MHDRLYIDGVLQLNLIRNKIKCSSKCNRTDLDIDVIVSRDFLWTNTEYHLCEFIYNLTVCIH